MIENKKLIKDNELSFFLWEITFKGKKQTGIVAGFDQDEYKKGAIVKHELTRKEKEQDRIKHIKSVGIQTGPVMLAYHEPKVLENLKLKIKKSIPDYNVKFKSAIHKVWKINSIYTKDIEKFFLNIKKIYIADGHHRSAAASKINSKNEKNKIKSKILGVIFDFSELNIYPYHRLLNDKKLINDLFNWMEKNKADYTNTFCNLMDINSDEIYKNNDFIDWKNEWKKRSELNNSTKEKQSKLMKSNNPIVIPRNHKVEEALAEADKGSLDKMKKLLAILKNPYDNQNNIGEYQAPAPSSNEKYQTFCGT